MHSIFTTTTYKYDISPLVCVSLAYLNAGLTITLTDMREKDEEGNKRQGSFPCCQRRTERVRRYIDSSREHLFDDVIYLKTEKQGVPIEVAIMYNTSITAKISIRYVNNINTIEGGTHLQGFRMALTRTLKKYADNNDQISKQISSKENRNLG
jgi:DNA gyrase subunit B